MLKTFFLVLTTFFLMSFLSVPVKAAGNNFVSIVNPVRGDEFWDLKDQKPIDGVKGQVEILKKQNLPATFLLRFDALQDSSITQLLIPTNFEKGLFLEVTPNLANAAQVEYHHSSSWHNAASVLITGYPPEDRIRLIDADFNEFKKIFGSYPKSVGAWWMDANSLAYMQQKYGVDSAMIVADQYSTDGYQIWGQYWSTPYYPAKNNALFPASDQDNKLNLVITQWAPRDPVNGYGKGVEESTLSVQANDYLDYHNLTSDYFSKLVDIYTTQKFNQFGQVVVGLENSYSWSKYQDEYQNQINILSTKQKKGQFKILTQEAFAIWYKSHFPSTSPQHLIYADDPLGSSKKALWFMNNFYRLGWIASNEGSIIRDLRQYIKGQDEICLKQSCSEVNFATFATRVLDEVTYGQRILIDAGTISNFKLTKLDPDFTFSYQNQAQKESIIKLLPQDIGINGKVSTIDGLILDHQQIDQNKTSVFSNQIELKHGFFLDLLLNSVKFLMTILILIFLPGYILSKLIIEESSASKITFFSLVLGMVLLTLIGFLSQTLLKSNVLIYFYLAIIIIVGVLNIRKLSNFIIHLSKSSILVLLMVLIGSIFQVIPTVRSGLEYEYGIGFWGPNGHDGIWHLALINQLENSVPPQNPILSGESLKNYHYFFDFLVSIVHNFSFVPESDLLFRFFPFLFSLTLGIATYLLVRLFNQKNIILSSIFALYFVYFAGSFGWIVDYLKNKTLNGESAFWANQAISFNLNPPFIISLLIVSAIILLLNTLEKKRSFGIYGLLIICLSVLFQFKAYGAILCFIALTGLVLFKIFKKDLTYLLIFVISGILNILLLIPSYGSLTALIGSGSSVFVYSPLWFVHSMIDSPDRVGIVRLTLSRLTGYGENNYLKIIGSETIGILLFIFGNLGTRIIGLTGLLKFNQERYLYTFLLCLFSILIPLFFIQKGTPWNTIQFFYYTLFITSIFASFTLVNIFKIKKIGVIIAVIILIITPINSLVVAQGYLYPKPHAFISKGEVEGLKFLQQQSSGIVLTVPFDIKIKNTLTEPLPLLAYDSTSYVSAYSGKLSYIEDENQQQILSTENDDYKKRVIEAKDFFQGRDKSWSTKFLNDNQIKYIYLPKIYKVFLNESELGLEKIFENDEVIIFKNNYN